MYILCINCSLKNKKGSTKIRPVPNTKENRDKIGLMLDPENVKAHVLCESCIEELEIEPVKFPGEK